MRVKVNEGADRRVRRGLSSDFAYEESLGRDDEDFVGALNNSTDGVVREGSVFPGLVRAVNRDYALVCIGSKSEGKIPRREFCRGDELEEIAVGSSVNVFLEKIENRAGIIVLSREKAIRYEMWDKLEKLYENEEEVEGVIVNSIKSGCIVDLGNILAFLPGSHIDLKAVKDSSQFVGKKCHFRILKMDKKQGNIVVSRRAILNSANAEARSKFLDTLEVGQILEGNVKSITHYGLFIGIHESDEVGVVDGLVHITDVSWSRVNHPSAFYSYGQRVRVKVIKIDKENGRISLGIKQLVENPWEKVEESFPVGTVASGCITSIEEYGVFVELAPGIEGLVHLSEVSWTRSNRPFSRGQEVTVKVVAMDTAKCRMSLSIKQCKDNPWQKFLSQNALGSKISCSMKNVVDSGIVVSFHDPTFSALEGFIRNIDIADDPSQAKHMKKLRVGDEITAKILQISTTKGSVSLGIKQLSYDPFEKFLSVVKVGDEVEGTVIKIDGRGVHIRVTNDIVVCLPQDSMENVDMLAVDHKHRFRIKEVATYSISLELIPDIDHAVGDGSNDE